MGSSPARLYRYLTCASALRVPRLRPHRAQATRYVRGDLSALRLPTKLFITTERAINPQHAVYIRVVSTHAKQLTNCLAVALKTMTSDSQTDLGLPMNNSHISLAPSNRGSVTATYTNNKLNNVY